MSLPTASNTLHLAVAQGALDSIRAILAGPAADVNGLDLEKKSPLFYACANLQLASLRLLLSIPGVKVNLQDCTGQTALHLAAFNGFTEGVQFLVERGAKCALKDQCGRLPLHLATNSRDVAAMAVLLNNTKKDYVNARDNEGMTAMHWASTYKRPNHTLLLVQKGAREDVFDVDKKTPLHWAAQHGSPMCCQILLDSRSAPFINSCDKSGNTCAHLAAAGGHSNIFKVLRRAPGFDLEAKDLNGRTPLMWAAASAHVRALQVLLLIGASPHARDNAGRSAREYVEDARHKDSPVHRQCASILQSVEANGLPPEGFDGEGGLTLASFCSKGSDGEKSLGGRSPVPPDDDDGGCGSNSAAGIYSTTSARKSAKRTFSVVARLARAFVAKKPAVDGGHLPVAPSPAVTVAALAPGDEVVSYLLKPTQPKPDYLVAERRFRRLNVPPPTVSYLHPPVAVAARDGQPVVGFRRPSADSALATRRASGPRASVSKPLVALDGGKDERRVVATAVGGSDKQSLQAGAAPRRKSDGPTALVRERLSHAGTKAKLAAVEAQLAAAQRELASLRMLRGGGGDLTVPPLRIRDETFTNSAAVIGAVSPRKKSYELEHLTRAAALPMRPTTALSEAPVLKLKSPRRLQTLKGGLVSHPVNQLDGTDAPNVLPIPLPPAPEKAPLLKLQASPPTAAVPNLVGASSIASISRAALPVAFAHVTQQKSSASHNVLVPAGSRSTNGDLVSRIAAIHAGRQA